MKNKDIIEDAVREVDMGDGVFSLGGYDEKLDELSKKEMEKVLDSIELGDYTDVDVKIKRKNYVVEISVVDKEMGFNVITRDEYISRYGDERYM